ncbi:hypothetical protein EDB89DRAFT_1906551 [Lactarius sanguifluus]|nr:hypothetical protein EDB89DRAFT_1906551 [Lactarius sanguifluus]
MNGIAGEREEATESVGNEKTGDPRPRQKDRASAESNNACTEGKIGEAQKQWSGTTNGACREDTEECPVVIKAARCPRTRVRCTDGPGSYRGDFSHRANDDVIPPRRVDRPICPGPQRRSKASSPVLLRADKEAWSKPTSEVTEEKSTKDKWEDEKADPEDPAPRYVMNRWRNRGNEKQDAAIKAAVVRLQVKRPSREGTSEDSPRSLIRQSKPRRPRCKKSAPALIPTSESCCGRLGRESSNGDSTRVRDTVLVPAQNEVKELEVGRGVVEGRPGASQQHPEPGHQRHFPSITTIAASSPVQSPTAQNPARRGALAAPTREPSIVDAAVSTAGPARGESQSARGHAVTGEVRRVDSKGDSEADTEDSLAKRLVCTVAS